jgi:aryl-alcohol dehydrogenase-like predicted oxidoreductase
MLALIRDALDRGFTFFDTAEVYVSSSPGSRDAAYVRQGGTRI